MRTAPASGATRIAEARVVWSAGRYLRFARKVRSPGLASSIPATPRISILGSPSTLQPSFSAISRSFIGESPSRGIVLRFWGQEAGGLRLEQTEDSARKIAIRSRLEIWNQLKS